MTPTPILAALLRSWVPLGEVKPWARACTAAGDKLSASALQAQATGRARPTPETFLAIGKAQARPAAEVSLAVALACGDERAAEMWRAVQGAAKSLDGVARLLELVSPEGADVYAEGLRERRVREAEFVARARA